MLSNLQKLSSGTKAFVESQFATFNALSGKAIEGGEKAIALNLAAVKAYAEESSAGAQQLISAKDPQEFFATAAAQAKLGADKASSYARNLAEIVAAINADFTKAAEAQIAESKNKASALVDEFIKNAPAGSENGVALLKSLISSANAGYEQLAKGTKQAVETVEANVVKVTDQLSQAVKKSA